MGGLSRGLALLFQAGRKRFGNAIDNFWLDAEARKAINDEVEKKFQPMIDRVSAGEKRKATNITELGNKLAESKKAFQNAQNDWQQKYNAELAAARNQRQTEIDDYNTQLQGYQDALDAARAGRQDILDQLYDSEKYDPNKTLYIDITNGKRYILDPTTGNYKTPRAYYKNLSQQALDKRIRGYETRLFDPYSGKVINPFDEANQILYKNDTNFDRYLNIRKGQNSTLIRNLRDADRQITQADTKLKTWQNANKKPTDWDDTPNSIDLKQFESNFTSKNGKLPKEYSFNGQTYRKEKDLDKAYQDALAREQYKQNLYHKKASDYASDRDKEIAKRIQDAKDIKKAKLALGTGAGAGALFAGAAAMYGGDDTDNTDNTNYGEPDPNFNVENIPEGQAQLKSDTASINTGFDPDKADALASAAYDQGVEDGNSARSSDDLVNSIAAATGGHTIDDRLFELIKAMQDPYKADAVANYIYSRHGDDPEVQRLGWRGWLNKYYGDSLRSRMNIDPSGYKGMHVSGGL